ncbi:MAG TPA: YdcF family protein [Saprospiraceae bacterium]|nr:YdcF family protein [Saprospiraceae bacterium]
MFFFLSKLLFFIIQPLNWVIGLLLYSLFSKKKKRKKRALRVAIVLAVFFSNHFLFNQVVKLWEPDPILISSIQKTYDIGIVLGGFSNLYIEPFDRQNFNETANRLTHALELYRKGVFKKILITGGSPDVLGIKTSEGERVLSFLVLMGIPKTDIIIEGKSRNTRENAVFTKALLSQQYPNAKCLLITSAFHMPRARACFKKLGLNFDTFPVAHIGEYNRFYPDSLLIPDRLGFYRWELLIKEWVGYLVYKIRAYA